MKPIKEKVFAGQWLFENGKIVGDETENRIWGLVRNRTTRVAERMSDGSSCIRIPCDGSSWELSFPQGKLQGGGPAKLVKLSPDDVHSLFPGFPTGPR